MFTDTNGSHELSLVSSESRMPPPRARRVDGQQTCLCADIWTLTVIFCSTGNFTDGSAVS